MLEFASHVPRAWLRSLSILISQDTLLLTCLAEFVQDPTPRIFLFSAHQTNPGIWARVRNSLALESYVRPGSRKSRSSRMGAMIESLHYKDDMESPTSTHSHLIAPSHSTFTTLLTTTTFVNNAVKDNLLALLKVLLYSTTMYPNYERLYEKLCTYSKYYGNGRVPKYLFHLIE